ncbi:LPXTG cell wall anchor domain-containing protein [Glycomyces sp. NPDC021274]|jgi:LPXTG-motif cell wall-anchored protein|uniref:LPXTG cell wall anchor domain-containing protein n=1 Tax=Glycomyces sp. NPDC021274 TaxID=3155120 RepID=UPI0033DFF7E7
MNRTLKRVLGLSGSVVLGLAGAVTFASAAQAHHPEIKGTVDCADDGGWTVTWQVTDWDDDDKTAGTITSVDAELNEDSEIKVGAPLPGMNSGDYLEGTQDFAADVPSAEITIAAKWEYDGKVFEDTRTGKVDAPIGGCTEEPPAEPEPVVEAYGGYDCFSVYVEANNLNEEALAEFTFVPSNGDPISYTPEVDEWFWEEFLVEDAAAGLTVDILVDGELYETITWHDNPLCHYASVEVDCESGLTYTLTVPADGEEITFYFYPSYNEEEIVEVVAPGDSKTVNFPPVDNEEFVVYWYIESPKDAASGDNSWTPCDEETPSPSDTPSAQPQLPTTGSSMTIMISSAAALIVAAAAIFLIMRRRRAAQDW